jgi:hypothetical protein
LGIVTEVKLQCEPRYDVIGLRSTQPELDGDFALFEPLPPNKPTIVDFLRDKPYARALWWPEPGIERLELWEASRFDWATHGQIIEDRLPPPQRSGVPSPALQLLARMVLSALAETSDEGRRQQVEKGFAEILASDPRAILQKLAELYEKVDPQAQNQLTWREFLLVVADLLSRLAADGSETTMWYPTPGPAPSFRSDYFPLTVVEQIVALLIDLFVPLSPRSDAPWVDWHNFPRKYSGQLFYDSWHKGLPMDNPIDDRLLPVTFTEAWIPFDRAIPALTKLREMFRQKRLAGTGTFAIELYAAKRSRAWLSPAHRGDVFRIDPFFFDNGDRAARDAFFAQYWDALEEFEPCYHWGKALPPATPERLNDLLVRFPRLQDFKDLRQKMDPGGRFLTDYWRTHLGIP